MNCQLREQVLTFLRREGAKITPRRLAIVEAAFSSAEHFSADELFERVRAKDQRVSRATVYRTLPLLVKSGLLRELHLDGERTLYDPNYGDHPDHSHIVCSDCGKIIEFDNSPIARLVEMISESKGMRVTHKEVQVEARCEKLARDGKCDTCTHEPAQQA